MLSEKEWEVLMFALEVAAERFKEDAEQARNFGRSGGRLAAQFAKQEEETRAVLSFLASRQGEL